MKIICFARNYVAHAEELKNKVPEEPVLFLKPDTSILLKKQPFFIPDFSDDIHYEIELIIKINKIAKHIDPKFAHKYYDEISVGIDFTARDVQAKLSSEGLPWECAKSFDGATVLGKWISKPTFSNTNALDIELQKNGEIVQQANTEMMIRSVDQLIAYASRFFTLKIGDILFTGTPAGVGKVDTEDKLAGFLNGQEVLNIKVK